MHAHTFGRNIRARASMYDCNIIINVCARVHTILCERRNVRAQAHKIFYAHGVCVLTYTILCAHYSVSIVSFISMCLCVYGQASTILYARAPVIILSCGGCSLCLYLFCTTLHFTVMLSNKIWLFILHHFLFLSFLFHIQFA